MKTFYAWALAAALLGCGGSGIDSIPDGATRDAQGAMDAMIECSPVTRPYELFLEPSTGMSSSVQIGAEIPDTRSPIIAGRAVAYVREQDGTWRQYGPPLTFDYRADPSATAEIKALLCLHQHGQPRTFRLFVNAPPDDRAIAIYGRFDQLYRSNLQIGGMAGGSEPAPDCSNDLELRCNNNCSAFVNFTVGSERICALRLR